MINLISTYILKKLNPWHSCKVNVSFIISVVLVLEFPQIVHHQSTVKNYREMITKKKCNYDINVRTGSYGRLFKNKKICDITQGSRQTLHLFYTQRQHNPFIPTYRYIYLCKELILLLIFTVTLTCNNECDQTRRWKSPFHKERKESPGSATITSLTLS